MINNVRVRNAMPQQDLKGRLNNFNEVELGYTEADVIREAMRCLNCRKKPCTQGCPINNRIPEFMAQVAQGNFEAAYEIISSKSCLPEICGRVCAQEKQCEMNCAHAVRGEAVSIGRVERFVADWYAARHSVAAPSVEKKGKKVAVIGSGPAGIACANDLADMGYDVTVFEKLGYAGGIMTYGIPQFVLPNEVVDRKIDALKVKGVEIVLNAAIDKDKTVDALFADGFEAVFVGNGSDVATPPRMAIADLKGVLDANDYLKAVNLNTADLPAEIKNAKKVLVMGGGNVAVDAVRCAKRLGAETIMVYRRTIAEAPARRDEMAHLKEENIALMELHNPVECYGKDGVLTGVKCEKMVLGEPDAPGRRSPVGTGEYVDVECDNLVIATGTTYSKEVVDTTTGIDKAPKGGIATDDDCKTSRPGVFAGGDAVTGPNTVVHAMGAGKRAAVSIDAYLSAK